MTMTGSLQFISKELTGRRARSGSAKPLSPVLIWPRWTESASAALGRTGKNVSTGHRKKTQDRRVDAKWFHNLNLIQVGRGSL